MKQLPCWKQQRKMLHMHKKVPHNLRQPALAAQDQLPVVQR